MLTDTQTIPAGYKMTEIGVIPEDWDVKKFANIAVLERGKFSARPRNDPKYYGGDIPFIQTGDVTNSDGEIISYSQTLNLEGLKVSRLFPCGTLFFTIAANIGDVGFTSFDTACPDSLIAITPSIRIDKRWLFHELKSRKKSFEVLATQNAQLNINLEKLRPYLLPIPPLSEQTAIATVLSDTDALIEGLEKLIAKKKAIKQGTMQQVLTGKKRLPGFEKKQGYKETKIGVIPEDWEVKKLGQCLIKNPDYGINAPAVSYSDNLPIYLRITDISEDGRFLHGNISSVDHSNSHDYFLENDDLVFARTGASVGKTYLYNQNDGQLVFAGFLIRVKTNSKKLNPQYFKSYTETASYWKWVKVMSMRSGQPGINGNEYSQLLISLPPLPEQTAIATILSDMNAEIESLKQKRDKYKRIKQGMMQQLLTGKIRL